MFSLITITGTYKYVRVLNASKGIALFYVEYLITFIVSIIPGLEDLKLWLLLLLVYNNSIYLFPFTIFPDQYLRNSK